MREFQAERAVRPDIASMDPYVPIVPYDVLATRLGRAPGELVKLDANENPYGPSPRTQAVLASLPHVNIYPDPESTALRKALARYTGVSPQRLLAGAGADELIDLVLRALLQPGDVVINSPPSFGMYPFATAVNMGKLVNVFRRRDFSLDVDALAVAVAANPRAKVLFVCSPNNPDGGVIADDELRALLRLPIVVILDEAYVEFSDDSRIGWVESNKNLVVLRTFSKWAGLAGLRVGYGAFPDWLMPHLWKIKQPYNVSVAAATAAMASLDDAEWLRSRLRAIVAERERLQSALSSLELLEPVPSNANFVLCRVVGSNARELKLELERTGILVRYFAKPGLEDCIRISVGRPEDTERLISVLAELSRGSGAKEVQ